MLVIGLTGGIGSGKSTVTALFAEYQIPIIDADVMAQALTQPGQPALKEIVAHFQQHPLVDKAGALNRRLLREIVFDQPHERQWLETLLHPLIIQQIKTEIAALKAPYCIVVIPLLFETGSYPFLDRILVVDTTEAIQIKRIAKRDKSSSAQIAAILKTQSSRKKRLEGADDIIVNDNDEAHLKAQVASLHAQYLKYIV
ncbi:MAG: dephospho-CoA kinase [uncultured bacterium]|nr:MAG: dephospho-CoA kinase [uncultured bacterium]